MKSLALFLILLATPAVAQLEFPRTVPMLDTNGVQVGTATVWKNRVVLRKSNGEIIGTIELQPDGTHVFYDSNGNELDRRIKPAQ